jgi:hypothetical protein
MSFSGSKHKTPRICGGSLGVMLLLLFACGQDPIFDMISREVEPLEPRVKGVPTKMVIFKYETTPDKWGMYVADSKLHRYAKNSGNEAVWDDGNIPQPPEGTIFDLAATTSYLYALVDPDSPKLYRFNRTSWTEVGFGSSDNQGYTRFQTIYGECGSDGKPIAGSDHLYVGASNSSGAYAVFYTDGTTGLTLLQSTVGLLSGAASDSSSNHYFATDGGGVYIATSGSSLDVSASWSPVSGAGGAIKGMIQLPTPPASVIAIRGNGDILTLSGSSAPTVSTSGVQNLRGPAAVWGDTSNTLLLIAVQIPISSSNSTYGYRELVLSSNPLPSGKIVLKEPGTYPSTGDDNKRYKDTIEPKPVNSLLQVPTDIDDNRILFASVQGRGVSQNNTDGGLWSYRVRDGIRQWNAEE